MLVGTFSVLGGNTGKLISAMISIYHYKIKDLKLWTYRFSFTSCTIYTPNEDFFSVVMHFPPAFRRDTQNDMRMKRENAKRHGTNIL